MSFDSSESRKKRASSDKLSIEVEENSFRSSSSSHPPRRWSVSDINTSIGLSAQPSILIDRLLLPLPDSISLPFSLELPTKFSLGTLQLEAAPHPEAHLPRPWIALLEQQFASQTNLASKLVTGFERYASALHRSSLEKPFGKISLPAGSSVQVFGATQPIAQSLADGIDRLNVLYIQESNKLVLKSLELVLTNILLEVKEFFSSLLSSRMDTFKEIIVRTPPLLLDAHLMQHFLFCTIRLACEFSDIIKTRMSAAKDRTVAKSSKQLALSSIIQETKEDLMDVEMSSSVISALIKKEVERHLSKQDSGKSPVTRGSKEAKTNKKQQQQQQRKKPQTQKPQQKLKPKLSLEKSKQPRKPPRTTSKLSTKK